MSGPERLAAFGAFSYFLLLVNAESIFFVLHRLYGQYRSQVPHDGSEIQPQVAAMIRDRSSRTVGILVLKIPWGKPRAG